MGAEVLSEAYWRTRFGADTGVVGRTVRIGGQPHQPGEPYQIVGVMPAAFDPVKFGWLGEQAFWIPFVPGPENDYGRYLLTIARLRPATSVESARAEMRTIAATMVRELDRERVQRSVESIRRRGKGVGRA